MSGDILDDIDAAIEEHEGYVEWHGSDDSATWAADGSHEVETAGHYYGDDIAGPWYQGSWYEILREIQYDATVTRDGAILWHRDLPPDPAETLRDVVVHWTAPEAPPVRPIEAVLREIAATKEQP